MTGKHFKRNERRIFRSSYGSKTSNKSSDFGNEEETAGFESQSFHPRMVEVWKSPGIISINNAINHVNVVIIS